jgi:hypothetical protein
MSDSLTLKWGTLKGWDIQNEETFALLQKWADLGSSYSAMAQRDTPEQKALICEIIDRIDGPIWNDWEGTKMTQDEAKAYVMNY